MFQKIAFVLSCLISSSAIGADQLILVCNGYNRHGNGLDVVVYKDSEGYSARVSHIESGVTLPANEIKLLVPEEMSDGRIIYSSVHDGLLRIEFTPPPGELGTRTGQGVIEYAEGPFPRIGMGCSF